MLPGHNEKYQIMATRTVAYTVVKLKIYKMLLVYQISLITVSPHDKLTPLGFQRWFLV